MQSRRITGSALKLDDFRGSKPGMQADENGTLALAPESQLSVRYCSMFFPLGS